MTDQDDVTRCGICGEPFKDGDIAVQTVRYPIYARRLKRATDLRREEAVENSFWAHPVCVFTIAREEEGPAEKHIPK
jgi:hypothetical protein